MTTPPRLAAPLVEAETAPLRRLARALVDDTALADDLVQDTWLAAVRSPPELDRPIRPWLARVLRRNLASVRRSSMRRAARERAVAPLGATEDPPAERVESIGMLLREIERLSASDRELLQLVFWDGLSSAECAARLGRPASTVRTRVQRTLERLRTRLDRRCGGRSAWTIALVPLARPRPAAQATVAATVLGAIGITAIVLWPPGCGAPLQALDDTASTSSAAASAYASSSATHDDAERASTDAKRKAHARWSAPPRAIPRTDIGTLKLAYFRALEEQKESFAECRDGSEAASVRIGGTLAFDDDRPPVVESVTFERIVGLTQDELECLRQTTLALDVAHVGPTSDEARAMNHRYDVDFATDGTVSLQGFRRGPPTDLFSQRKGGGDLDDAIAACGPGGATLVRLTFDPATGGVTEIDVAHSRVGTCIEDALRATLRASVSFEPERPEDATIVCTFDAAGHACERLGPDGGYL